MLCPWEEGKVSLNGTRNAAMCTVYVHRRGVEGCAKDNNCCLDIGGSGVGSCSYTLVLGRWFHSRCDLDNVK